MSDIIKNPYFNPQPQQENSIPMPTFEPEISEVEGAPKAEPEKGFTSIIMPVYLIHYPAFHYTGTAIGAIREHTDKEKTPYELILVLNGTKETIKFDNLQQTNADKIIENEENLGYAKAVNQGIRVARGEYIAIINNDTQVYNYWLEDLQESLQKVDLIMSTPMYGMPFARAQEAYKLRDKTLGKSIEETFSEFRDFSCVLTRKEMFNKIGLFNEEFFMYGEDLDLLRRMDQAGLKYASTKRVNHHHIIGATSSSIQDSPDIMNKSKELLRSIWGY